MSRGPKHSLADAYRAHACRVDEYPAPVELSFADVNMDVYGLMWGTNEYVLLDGARFRDWDVRDRLGEVDVPTLVLSDEHDEISPDIVGDIADRIPEANLVVFDDSSHMPFWEQPDEHYEVVESFLAEHMG